MKDICLTSTGFGIRDLGDIYYKVEFKESYLPYSLDFISVFDGATLKTLIEYLIIDIETYEKLFYIPDHFMEFVETYDYYDTELEPTDNKFSIKWKQEFLSKNEMIYSLDWEVNKIDSLRKCLNYKLDLDIVCEDLNNVQRPVKLIEFTTSFFEFLPDIFIQDISVD